MKLIELLIYEVGAAYLVGLTVIIRLVSVPVKLYLNCQLELSLAKVQKGGGRDQH